MRDGKVLFTTRCIEIMELQFVPKDNYGNLRFYKNFPFYLPVICSVSIAFANFGLFVTGR